MWKESITYSIVIFCLYLEKMTVKMYKIILILCYYVWIYLPKTKLNVIYI